jgi:hypothetical protein
MGTLFVDKLDPQSGTSLEIGSSGDTITIPSGCTITNNGTQTGFGGTNTPRFLAYKNSGYQNYGDSSTTKIIFDAEEHDSDSAYDTSNYRFTVPSGKAGVYQFGSSIVVQDVGATSNVTLSGFKNGTGGTRLVGKTTRNFQASTSNVVAATTFVATLAAADYVEMYVTTPSTSGAGDAGLAYQYFYGYKLL